MTTTWRQITRNHWVAKLPGYVSIEVTRNPRWKRLSDGRPFKVVVFGNIWAQQHREGFDTLDDAQREAERIARKTVRGLVRWAANS